MSIWDRFRTVGRRYRDDNISRTLNEAKWFGDVEVQVARIDKLSPEDMFRTQPHLRTVVTFVARQLAQLRFHCYAMSADGESRTRDRTSVLARLMRKPNTETTGYELWYSTVADLALYDNALWMVAVDEDRPDQLGWSLVHLPWAWVDPVNASPFQRKGYKIKTPGNDEQWLDAKDAIVFHGYNPDDARAGLAPVEALKGILQDQLHAIAYRQQVWKRGGRVSSVLTRPVGAPRWSDRARERFRDDWYASYAGAGSRAGGTPILDDGMTLEKVDYSAKDQQFVDGTKLNFGTVCSVYHINPTMVGLLDNANFSNVREFRKALYGDSLGPVINQLEDRVNAFLIPMLGMDPEVHFGEFNVSEKLAADFEAQTDSLVRSIGGPWRTRNEGRKLQNLPPVEDGDELIIPLNVLVGGQANPADSGTQNEVPNAEPQAASGRPRGKLVLLETAPSKRAEAVFQKHVARQEQVVRSLFGAKGGGDWWDGKRWDAELAADLEPLLGLDLATQAAEAFNSNTHTQLILAGKDRQDVVWNTARGDRAVEAARGLRAATGDSTEDVG